MATRRRKFTAHAHITRTNSDCLLGLGLVHGVNAQNQLLQVPNIPTALHQTVWMRYIMIHHTIPKNQRICLNTTWDDLWLKVNRQRPTSVTRRTELKISTLAKWLISPSVCVVIKICKKHLVLKTSININIYIET